MGNNGLEVCLTKKMTKDNKKMTQKLAKIISYLFSGSFMIVYCLRFFFCKVKAFFQYLPFLPVEIKIKKQEFMIKTIELTLVVWKSGRNEIRCPYQPHLWNRGHLTNLNVISSWQPEGNLHVSLERFANECRKIKNQNYQIQRARAE